MKISTAKAAAYRLPSEIIQRATIHLDRARNNSPVVRICTDGEGAHCHPLECWVRYHSPDGFEFGYGGSGPTELALHIALLLYPPALAQIVYQELKWRWVAGVHSGAVIRLADVDTWAREVFHNEFREAGVA